MNLTKTKKLLSHSANINEITQWNYQLIYTPWEKNLKAQIENQDISSPELLKQEVNLLDSSQKKFVTKHLSKQIFAINFNNNQKKSTIKKLKDINLPKKIISNTKILLFKNKEEIVSYIKKQKNIQNVTFWFIQLKQFFFLTAKNNVNAWYINQSNIKNAITTINIAKICFFYINIKAKKNSTMKH